MKVIAAFLFSCFVTCFVNAQYISGAENAFALAKEKNKPLLLVFSGSDWCAPCMRFEKNVLEDPVFERFCDSSLIVLQADFPQTKKLLEETVQQNEKLAEKYNPKGTFPLIVLLYPDGSVCAYLKYKNDHAQDFIAMIRKYLCGSNPS